MEVQAAIRRRRAEARVESLRFLETTTAESEQSMQSRSDESSVTELLIYPQQLSQH